MPIDELAALSASLSERSIPLVVDEVYHPLFFGTPARSAAALANTIVVGDFSKALSLSGLRIGWLIDRDARRRDQLINLRSYFTVSGSPITEGLAVHVLAHRRAILARLEGVARANLKCLENFMARHATTLGWARPAGGTVAFPWRLDGADTRPMCEALARDGVLVAPGDCFDAPAHLRVGFGALGSGIEEALDIASQVLALTIQNAFMPDGRDINENILGLRRYLAVCVSQPQGALPTTGKNRRRICASSVWSSLESLWPTRSGGDRLQKRIYLSLHPVARANPRYLHTLSPGPPI